MLTRSPLSALAAVRRRRGGLTILEVAVVAVITAALVVTLIPAVSAARDRAVVASCLANQRTLGLGWSRYINDYHQLPGENYQEGCYFAAGWGRPYFYGGVQAWMSTADNFWDGILFYDVTNTPQPTESVVSGVGYVYPYVGDDGKTFYCPGTAASFTSGWSGGEPWWAGDAWYKTWTGTHQAGYYGFGQQGKGTLTTYFFRGGQYDINPDLPDADPRWGLNVANSNWTNNTLSSPDSPWVSGRPFLTCFWPGYNGVTLDDPMMSVVPHKGKDANLLYADGSARDWKLPHGVLPVWCWFGGGEWTPSNYDSNQFYQHMPWWWVLAERANR